ncbi:MAG: exodeoxyribonuclease VII large subunit [Alphaproteobacteria bacterium]|nr:exodeoxyribonuclease VII large subunit [Alphaproteobacteria bacterium]
MSIATSGHMYSSLKDQGAVIDAVCWKGTLAKIDLKPEEGLEVICTGRISTFPQRSNYQLIVESMELAGEGALLKMLEERRKKLLAEGLFAPQRKRPIPFLPDVIGVVTSPTGAVIRDILHRLSDRFPRHVLVWPVLVQGEQAAAQVAAAIRGFQSLPAHGLPRPDVLIVARGGGSLEDLMGFNDEGVVRAIAESKIPVISAIGHETDTTLADYAADLRAPTPTGAAEMAVPVRAALAQQILEYEQRLASGMNRFLAESRHRLEARSAGLGDPARLLEAQVQRLDHLGDKLSGLFGRFIEVKRSALVEIAGALVRPQERLREAEKALSRWGEQLGAVGVKLLQDKDRDLKHAGKMLEAYSFENILQRGFAVVRDGEGALIMDAARAGGPGASIEVQFRNDGRLRAQVSGSVKGQKDAPLKKPVRDKEFGGGQTSLF